MPEPKLVHAVKTKTRTYIEIHETGSQSGIRKIELTIHESEAVYRQLEDILYGAKDYECTPENMSNPSSD